jgi:hypothetical protein
LRGAVAEQFVLAGAAMIEYSSPTGSADRIPVIYITAPPKGSPRKLAMEFARFLGLPVTSRANATDIADAVCQVLIDARCDIVIIDELHNVNMATTVGEDYSDHMKYFTMHLPATFVCAGIDVQRSGMITGDRGKQLAGRWSPPGRSPTRTSGSSSSRAWKTPCGSTVTSPAPWWRQRSTCTSAPEA